MMGTSVLPVLLYCGINSTSLNVQCCITSYLGVSIIVIPFRYML